MEEDESCEFGDPAAALLLEAEDTVKDIGSCVKEAVVSEKLPTSAQSVFVNIETKELVRYCVEVSTSGFRVVGSEYDVNESADGQFYETVYMLLDSISPMYRASFADNLALKLQQLADDRSAPTTT